MDRNGRRANGENKNNPLQVQRAQHNNIQEKLELGTELGFAGHIVSQNGIRPDDDKYKAIKEFPAPKNQLEAFVPDLAHMLAGLRPLLKKKNMRENSTR